MNSRAYEDENKDIQYAYNCITDFFNFFGLSNALKNTGSMLTAAVSYKIWKKAAPSRLLFLKEKLEELFNAALTIHYGNAVRTEAILNEPANPDMSAEQHYVCRFTSCTVWNSFPRSLTEKQYNDPYKALKKFAEYMTEQKWKQTLKDCVECALSNNLVYELHPPYNILTARLRLLQLIEACHLLNLRTGVKPEDHQINKSREAL